MTFTSLVYEITNEGEEEEEERERKRERVAAGWCVGHYAACVRATGCPCHAAYMQSGPDAVTMHVQYNSM